MSQPIEYSLTLTQPEREVLLAFIDAGLKVSGLNSAQNAVHLATKIQNAREIPVLVPAPSPEPEA